MIQSFWWWRNVAENSRHTSSHRKPWMIGICEHVCLWVCKGGCGCVGMYVRMWGCACHLTRNLVNEWIGTSFQVNTCMSACSQWCMELALCLPAANEICKPTQRKQFYCAKLHAAGRVYMQVTYCRSTISRAMCHLIGNSQQHILCMSRESELCSEQIGQTVLSYQIQNCFILLTVAINIMSTHYC